MTPETFAKWRPVPRALMIGYGVFFAVMTWKMTAWVMAYDFNALDNETLALAVVGFPAAILTVLSGVLMALMKHFITPGYKANGGNGN
jgi:hypothetical protein